MDPASVTTNPSATSGQAPVEPVVPAPVIPPVVVPEVTSVPEPVVQPATEPMPAVDTLQSTVSVATPPAEAKPVEPAPSGEDLQQLTQQLMNDLQNMQTPGQQTTANNQQTTEPVPAAPVVEASQPVTVQPSVVEPVVSVPEVSVPEAPVPVPTVPEPVVAAPVAEQPTTNKQQTTNETAPVTENKVTVYTTSNCPFCKAEKEYLFSKGLKYDEKNVETDEVALKDMLTMSDNFAGVPVTLLQNSKGEKLVVKGFTKDEFEQELVKLGMLTASTSPASTAA
ncbi:MAG: glutaredoxin family protein [Patescibacteria group bacterium]